MRQIILKCFNGVFLNAYYASVVYMVRKGYCVTLTKTENNIRNTITHTI